MLENDYLYFDTAATALTPTPVIEAIRHFYAEGYGTVNRAVYHFAAQATDACHKVRQKAAAFLNASEEEIIFTKGTTDAINLVAQSFGRRFLNLGDEVVITKLEHHSNIVPWQMICDQRGAILKEIPVDDAGELILDEADTIITPKTKIVSLGHIANSIGTENPIQEIIAMARRAGAKVFIDGAQAAPHMQIDVKALDCDFYAFSGHKLYGPTGIGVLYGKKEVLDDLPPYQGGGDMIEKVTFEETTYQRVPYRFEAGTPNIAGILGLGAALDYVQRIGLDKIHAHEMELLALATDQLQQIDRVHILGSPAKKGAIIAFTVDRVHPLDLGTLLDLKKIAIRTGHLCAQPALARFGLEHAARLSFGLYNTSDEVERFISALKDTIMKL